ncbi:hypothetical protein PSTT_03614 [Puccinia striiformis]|uniref:Uncharacterized protein n=1 Tax=Puccinia striiformis TaxID=27350 RepID=A0A2S4VVV5_9BASI|nr:hypothetical protein PSTT_03614 [Puccinia striiformis]
MIDWHPIDHPSVGNQRPSFQTPRCSTTILVSLTILRNLAWVPRAPVPGQREFMPLFELNTQGQAISGAFDTQGHPNINPGYFDPAQDLYTAGMMALQGQRGLFPSQSQTQLGWHSPSQLATQSSQAAMHSMGRGWQYPSESQLTKQYQTPTQPGGRLLSQPPSAVQSQALRDTCANTTSPKQTRPLKRRVPAPVVAENGQILIELEYLLFSRAVTQEVIQAIGSRKPKATQKKGWQPILPKKTETLPVWHINPGHHTWIQFQQGVVKKLGTSRDLLVPLLQDPDIIPLVKWQLCIPYRTKYAPARKFYAASAEDYVHFTQQIKENPGCKVAVKLIMTHPELVAKDTVHETCQNRSLTLNYGIVKAKAAIVREEAHLAVNPKAHTSSNPAAPYAAAIMSHIHATFGCNKESLWIKHP